MQRDNVLSSSSKQPPVTPVTPSTITRNGRLDPLTLGVVGMDNRPAVVIDVGVVLTKFVFFLSFIRNI